MNLAFPPLYYGPLTEDDQVKFELELNKLEIEIFSTLRQDHLFHLSYGQLIIILAFSDRRK